MVASESPVPDLNPGYGYLWWLGAFTAGDTETHFAAGWSGQFIFVVPETGMVVAFTAGGFENWDYSGPLQIVNHHVLPATGGQ